MVEDCNEVQRHVESSLLYKRSPGALCDRLFCSASRLRLMSSGECSNDMKSLSRSSVSWGSVGVTKELHKKSHDVGRLCCLFTASDVSVCQQAVKNSQGSP